MLWQWQYSYPCSQGHQPCTLTNLAFSPLLTTVPKRSHHTSCDDVVMSVVGYPSPFTHICIGTIVTAEWVERPPPVLVGRVVQNVLAKSNQCVKHIYLSLSNFFVCLLFDVLATSKVISGWVPTCDSVHSRWLYRGASLEHQSARTRTCYPAQSYYPDTEQTSQL